MKINEYYAFQRRAVGELHQYANSSHLFYNQLKRPQVISFTAPTGAGKTIMMATLIEDIYNGTDGFPENSDAIFVWLSDSPELNQQSKDKIDIKADKIRLDQCVTISEESFDRETLEEGHIYFLNTQKLGKSSNLLKHSDNRQYTIWETLQNTINQKSDLLYFIIDEAHRGMQDNRAAHATTIMQKFIKGSPEDGIPAMPVVIGMSATSERFNVLVRNTQSSVHSVIVTPDEVKASGLLKDRIIITYPDPNTPGELAVLEAATDEWKEKCLHWELYCNRRNQRKIDPIFLIQVKNGNTEKISATDLDACVQKIEQRANITFTKGEIVHTFGQTTGDIMMNGLEVPYIEPSKINEDRRIKVVFFKENLSTGWDCPRAECMVSFRTAEDATYIAQLVGRMVRTPMGWRVQSDESLNEVNLFLPNFDKKTVEDVVKHFNGTEGDELPTEILTGSLSNGPTELLSSNSPLRHRVVVKSTKDDDQYVSDFFSYPENVDENNDGNEVEVIPISTNDEVDTPYLQTQGKGIAQKSVPLTKTVKPKPYKIKFTYEEIDRHEIIKYINELGLTTYEIRSTRINDYLPSMFSLARFLSHTNIDKEPLRAIKREMVEMIYKYVHKLKVEGDYDGLKAKVLSFELHSQVFDIYGNIYQQKKELDLFSQTDMNIDIQARQADQQLGNEGICNAYGNKYADEDNPYDFKIDVILYTLLEENLKKLNEYAKEKFQTLNDTYRRSIIKLDENFQKKWNDIVKDGNKVSKINFILPSDIEINKDQTSDKGDVYSDHLYVNTDTNTAKIKLNEWEKAVIKEEEHRSDFICWLRNVSRRRNSLCLCYSHNGQNSAFYPDFIIVRKDATDYIVDILEPHNPSFDDNVGKAKALAEYASEHNITLGRAEMIRYDSLEHKYVRLDMCKSNVKSEVLKIQTAEELNHLFDKFGYSY